jgi:CRP-like cAMP-binding protein
MSVELSEFPVLRELSKDELETLLPFFEEARYDDGRTVYNQSDEASELLLITEGAVRLELDDQKLGELAAGSALGGASLVRIGKRGCSAYAHGALVTLRLSRESYLRLRAEFPQAALALQEGILRTFASVAEKLAERARRSS